MPINPNEIKWDDKPAIDESSIKWDTQEPAQGSPKQLSFEKPENPYRRAYNLYGKPIVEMGGMAAGSALGFAGAGPAGAVVGGSLGYAQAKKIVEITDRFIDKVSGEETEDKTLKQEVMGSLKDIRTGMTLEMMGQSVGALVVKGIGKIIAPYAKRMTPERTYTKQSTESYGMKMSPAEATESKELGLIESMMEKSPRSADLVRDWQFDKQLRPLMERRQEVIDSVASTPKDIDDVGRQINKEVTKYLEKHTKLRGAAMDRLRGRIVAKLGAQIPAEEAGINAQATLGYRSQRVREMKNKNYEEVANYLPEDNFETPNLKAASERIGIEMDRLAPGRRNPEVMNYVEWGRGENKMSPLLQEQLDSFPANVREQILSQMEKESPGLFTTKRDWQTLQQNRAELSDILRGEDAALKYGNPAFKNQVTPTGRRIAILKKAIEADMKAIAKTTGGQAWQQLQIADTFYSSNIPKVFRHKLVRQLAYANPSKIADIIFAPRAIEEVRLAKAALGEPAFMKLRDQFVTKMLGRELDTKNLAKQLKLYGDDYLKNVFKPAELNFLKKSAQSGIDLAKIEVPGESLMKKIANDYPDTVVDSLIGAPEAYKQSSTILKNIRQIKKVISKDSFENIGRSFAEKVFKKQTNSDLISPEAFSRIVRKYSGREVFKELYPYETIGKIKELAHIAEKISGAQRLSANPSGTGQVGITWGTFGMILRNPIKGGTVLIAPKIMGRLWYSKAGMKYLTDGFKLPLGTKKATENLVKLIGIINEQEE